MSENLDHASQASGSPLTYLPSDRMRTSQNLEVIMWYGRSIPVGESSLILGRPRSREECEYHAGYRNSN